MSYVNFDAKTVSLACERYLTARSEAIDLIREECIQEMMLPQFFGLVKMSRERAIRWLDKDPWHTYNMCTVRGGANANIVEELLTLANAAIRLNEDKTVMVNSETAYILRNYL
jgi:hypothetical protein